MWDLSREAWERFLVDEGASALLEAFRQQPPRVGIEASYPERHRLCDVSLEEAAYRVCRFVDLETGEVTLSIEPTEFAGYEQEGVPYALQGEALCAWVKAEREHPAKAEADWDAYLT